MVGNWKEYKETFELGWSIISRNEKAYTLARLDSHSFVGPNPLLGCDIELAGA